MKFLSFDIETAKLASDNEDASCTRPLGITCGAIAWMAPSGIKSKARHGVLSDGSPAPKMSKQECVQMVMALMEQVDRGYVLLAHNGVRFDFDILAEESGLHKECIDLALNSVDFCFHIHCLKGHPIGLAAIAKGMKLEGKTEGMNGSMAPQMWADGKYEQVLEYVQQDVRSMLTIAMEIEKRRGLSWVTKAGKRSWQPISTPLRAHEALELPVPNTLWMDSPIPREQFTGWMQAVKAG